MSKTPAGTSFLAECVALGRNQPLRVDEMLGELDAKLAAEVEAVLRDPSIPSYRIHRALADRGVACSYSAIGRWRRDKHVIR